MPNRLGWAGVLLLLAGCGESADQPIGQSGSPTLQSGSPAAQQELTADRAARALTEVIARQCLAVEPNAIGSFKIHEQTRDTAQYTDWLQGAVVPHYQLVSDDSAGGHINRTYTRQTPFGPATVTFRMTGGAMPITDITGCFMFPQISVRDVAPFPSAPEGTFVVTYQAIPKGLAGEFPFPPPGSLEVVHWPVDRPYQAIIQRLDDGSTIVHSTGYPS